jgi:hypothetical protein
MAFRKSPSSGRSAPKANQRLAAFSAYVDAVADGEASATEGGQPALELALNKRDVMRCSTLWKTFSQQVGAATDHRRPAVRVVPPSQALPPLP